MYTDEEYDGSESPEVDGIDYEVGDDVTFRDEVRTKVGTVLGFVSNSDDPDDIDTIYMLLEPDEYGNVAHVGHFKLFTKFQKELLH